MRAVTSILEQHFREVALDEFDWLYELVDIGCQFEEMAKLLIDGEAGSPWILIDTPPANLVVPRRRFYQENCVHKGGHKLDTIPKVISTNTMKAIGRRLQKEATGVKDGVGKLCGLAGVRPLVDEHDKPEWMRWTSCVQFMGEENSVAWVSYAELGYPAYPEIWLSRIIDTLRRTCSAIGFL